MALYAALGNPRGLNPRDRHPVPNESAETMVGKLAERLEAQPDNPQGWLMLARSYKVLQRYAESADAWEHAKSLAWDDAEAMAEWTEARILSQGQRFDRRSQELLARAMSLDANAPGVLMLRALAALDRGDAGAAQKVMTQLRDMYPEGSADRQALDAALAQLAAGRDPRVSQPGQPNTQDPSAPDATKK
jgi:cytochrome c-type biogenesis protein CcmH